jgi:hypothetical protein
MKGLIPVKNLAPGKLIPLDIKRYIRFIVGEFER